MLRPLIPTVQSRVLGEDGMRAGYRLLTEGANVYLVRRQDTEQMHIVHVCRDVAAPDRAWRVNGYARCDMGVVQALRLACRCDMARN